MSGPLTKEEIVTLAQEAIEAAMEIAAARHGKLEHCKYWSFHQQALLSYAEWIKERWDDDTTDQPR